LSPAITEARIARLVAKNDWYYSLHMEGESVTDDMQHLDGAIQVYMSALQMEYYDPR
jgi:predicted transcriptional regulator